MRVHRLQNPFEHWLRGLVVEILAYAAFLAFAILVVTIIALVR